MSALASNFPDRMSVWAMMVASKRWPDYGWPAHHHPRPRRRVSDLVPRPASRIAYRGPRGGVVMTSPTTISQADARAAPIRVTAVVVDLRGWLTPNHPLDRARGRIELFAIRPAPQAGFITLLGAECCALTNVWFTMTAVLWRSVCVSRARTA
jgi:hypothetical protein